MPRLVFPKTFNEKILRKILFDRNPRLTLFADKYLVRDFVQKRLGAQKYLTKLYAVIENPEEISNLDLPDRFVMKATHTSGDVKIIRDITKIDRSHLTALAATWLKRNKYLEYKEWAYKNIRPRIIFEELLESDGKIPDDWKFFCFKGDVHFIQVDKGRFETHRRNIYDAKLSLLPMRYAYDNFQEKIMPPAHFARMLEAARKLSKGIDFIRVDFYNIDGRIVFGELTNYPEGGIGKFDPDMWDLELGKRWR